jgi:hypothetical protein
MSLTVLTLDPDRSSQICKTTASPSYALVKSKVFEFFLCKADVFLRKKTKLSAGVQKSLL